MWNVQTEVPFEEKAVSPVFSGVFRRSGALVRLRVDGLEKVESPFLLGLGEVVLE